MYRCTHAYIIYIYIYCINICVYINIHTYMHMYILIRISFIKLLFSFLGDSKDLQISFKGINKKKLVRAT